MKRQIRLTLLPLLAAGLAIQAALANGIDLSTATIADLKTAFRIGALT